MLNDQMAINWSTNENGWGQAKLGYAGKHSAFLSAQDMDCSDRSTSSHVAMAFTELCAPRTEKSVSQLQQLQQQPVPVMGCGVVEKVVGADRHCALSAARGKGGYRKLWSLVNSVKRGQSVCPAEDVSVSCQAFLACSAFGPFHPFFFRPSSRCLCMPFFLPTLQRHHKRPTTCWLSCLHAKP
jgi:hypothetical protein